MTSSPSLPHCPHAIAIREKLVKGRYTGITPQSSRRQRRSTHRYIWKNLTRHQANFPEAWRAFNNTLKGELLS